MNPKITVVVPVYNTGEILRQTLDSILAQTFQDFELIIVDDGSTDISPDICDEYAKKDSRIIVIHQKNGGICAARNAGIKKTRSKYITFCDHDDYYAPRKLEIQYNLAIKYNADIVNVGYNSVSEVSNRKDVFQKDIVCCGIQELRDNIYDITYYCISTIWVKLYNIDKLRQVFYFDEKYTRGHEDINFNLKVLNYIDSFVSTKEILYEHVQRINLSTSAKVHREVLVGMYDHIINFIDLIEKYKLRNRNNIILYARNLSHIFRVYAMYSIKAKISKDIFIKKISSIDLFENSYPWCKLLMNKNIPQKDIFVLYCVVNKRYSLLFNLLKLYEKFVHK